MKKLILYLFLFLAFEGYAQPANDACSGAISLGTLGAPGVCGVGTQNGTVKTVAGTLTGATPESPYVTEGPCSSGTMASPANDVWYTFVPPVGGPQASISITGAAFTPNIAVWSGSCANPVGMGCTVGTPGSATLIITGNLIAGQTYFIQISGNTGQSGGFTLHVNSFFVCGDCNTGSSFTVTPLPVNGMYTPGQTVQFCYHVSSYVQLNTNWLHGVQFTFGSGWNAASITTTSPGSCDGSGTWAYYPGGTTSSASGVAWPAGFYYNSSLGGCSCVDGNPGDNYGDDCSGNIAAGTWIFCVSLTVSNVCNPGADLSVAFNTSGDGESGIWSDNGCNPDPPTNFLAIQSCCPPTISVTNLLCNGISTGSATTTAVVGGAGNQNPYVFNWTGGATATNTVVAGTSDNLSNLPAGTYTVVVTDKNLCAASTTVTITQPTAISATVTPTAATCAGLGSIATTVSGGTSPYTYVWTGPGAYTSTIKNPTALNPGTYSLTITDNNNCTYTITTSVTQTGTITVTATSPSICAGDMATITSGGATTYSWTAGVAPTTGSVVTVSPGATTSYTVTGTTGTCTNTAVATVNVTAIPTVTVNNPTICSGTTATLTANGATTYNWTAGVTPTTGSVVTASPGSTTSYTVTGTTGTCTNTAVATVSIAASLSITVTSATICSGTSTPLTANGGTTYSWTPATGLSTTTGSIVTANPVTTTTYTVNGNTGGCTGTATSVVTVNPMPTVTVNSPSICIGNNTTLTATGATTFSWTPATGLSATNIASVTANPTVTTTYTIVGTSATCTASATSILTVNPLPTVTVNSATVCPGASATLNAAGASTYTWNTAATGASITDNPASTTNYTVTGTSAAGCVSTATTSITVLSTLVVFVNSATICTGSSTTLTTGGAATYSWTPATGLSSTSGISVIANPVSTTIYTVTGSAGTCSATATSTVTVNPLPLVIVNSGTICIGQQTATLTAANASTYSWTPATGLSSSTGTSVLANPTITTSYTVTGTDANGCVNTATTSVTVNPLPTITVNSATICPTFSATLNPIGASTYTWNTGANGSLTDAPASTTSYTVVGTDINGCLSGNTATITVNATLLVSASNNSPICAGATINLTASTGISWSWTGPGGYTSAAQNPTIINATPAMSGTYSITATDVNGCQGSAVTTVTVNPLPVIVIGSNSPVCVNQTLTLTSTGGSGYAWSGPNSFSSTLQNPTIAGVTMAASGIYSLTVTDVNTCVNTATVTVIINALPIVTATGATVCIGATINLAATGGVTYSWGGPNVYTSNLQNPSITNAVLNMAGNYVVTVTDINGCVNANVAQVVVNPSLLINATNSGPVCQNSTLNLFASSGISWNWTGPGGFISFIQNPIIPNAQLTVSGIYTVTGTDANGCQGTNTTTVLINVLPNVTASSGTICVTEQTATLTALGASTYTWNPAFGLSSNTGSIVTANPIVTTSYTITGTDANGCVSTGTSTVTVNSLPTVTATSGVICFGNTTTLNANGAATYTWVPAIGLSSANGTPVTAGPAATTSYTITGTDVNGCFSSGTSTVTVNPLPIVNVTSGIICIGNSTTLTANGATTYSWTPPTGLSATTGASVMANPNATTSYSVIGTDLNGCNDTANTLVIVNPLPVLSITPPISSGCAPVCVNFTNTTTATGTCNWIFGDGTISSICAPNHCFTGQGTFFSVFTLTDANGCKNSDTAQIIVYSVPKADFSFDPQPTTILDPVIYFHNQTVGAYITNNSWTFGDPLHSTSALTNPSHTYLNTGSYSVQLVVTSNYGCKDSTTKIVIIGEDYFIYVPNAFSPNGDGINETFFAKGEGIKDFKMYIFDRWGNQVFYSEDIFIGWDGTYQAKGTDVVQEDVYVWKIELKNFKGESKTLKGIVSLLK